MELMMEYMARGFMTMLSISMPCVLTAASVGLIVGILQAVTQVQEQTIAAAPKILSVFLVITIGGYGFVRLLSNLTTDGFAMAFNVIPKNDEFVLPSDYYKYTRPFAGEMNDKIAEPTNLRDKMKKSSRIAPTGSQQTPDRWTPSPTPEQSASLLERLKLGR
ncbi:flagellar biosynthetic protein FliQ [bacterium]|nr:flagellar biosynthetic protein FliQ [bacterium]